MKAASAQVVLPGVPGEFSYLVPSACATQVRRGVRVLVPFRARRVTAFVVDTHPKPVPEATRAIEQLLEESPSFADDMLDFTKWVADYYLCPWGDALRAALPAGLDAEDQYKFALADNSKQQLDLAGESYSPEVAELLDALEESPLTARQIQQRFGLDPDGAELRALKQAGRITYGPYLRGPRTGDQTEKIIELTARAQDGLVDESLWTFIPTRSAQRLMREVRDAGAHGIARRQLMRGASKQRKQALDELVTQGFLNERREVVSRWRPDAQMLLSEEADAPLTDPQQSSLEQIAAALEAASYRGFLLFGVTGSGKTRVYIEAIQRCLSRGKTALVLVPEISLTPILWGRFRAAFGDNVAIQHSAQATSVRYDVWRGIARGDYSVVIGARSAVFAPLRNLGLIVVDEEHEASYKQSEGAPRYSARDAALYRARQHQAVALLGSATPSLESFYAAQTGKLTLLTLPERATGAALPRVELIAPAAEPPANATKEQSARESDTETEERVLSEEALSAIDETLKAGKQAIVLQNRRGFAPFLICRHCGKLFECPNCSVSLTYHRPGRIMLCHYCHHRDDAPGTCPACGANDLALCGSGTQRVADELAAALPDARIARMDSDVMTRLGAHEQLMSAFAQHKHDVLVGTQMVAKGLDFARVELAIVADSDTELFYPDFRASERGASLLMQLSGRAGRASQTGRVLLQTRARQHPAIQAAIHGNWSAFAEQELTHREQSGFPPYCRLALLRAIAADESLVARAMLLCKRHLEGAKPLELLGPSPCAVVKVRNRIRYQLLARTSKAADPTGSLLRGAVQEFLQFQRNSDELKRVQWEVDVDPASTA